VLPIRPLAVVLVVAAMVAFAVDVQVGVPRVWTAIGSVLCAVGLLALFDGVPTPWPATIGAIAAVIVFMVFGMPAMTRSRFSTPMIDRTWLVGREGTVVEACRPDGVVRVDEALWAGRGDAEVPVGTPVRVTGIDGVICRVEPI
jgi:membrane-bound serine protease (ClpP class)